MKNYLFIALALVALGSFTPKSHAMFALHHEGKTDLAFNARTNNAMLVERYKVVCTIAGDFSQSCMDASLRALAKDGVRGSGYMPTVKIETELYPSLARRLGVK